MRFRLTSITQSGHVYRCHLPSRQARVCSRPEPNLDPLVHSDRESRRDALEQYEVDLADWTADRNALAVEVLESAQPLADGLTSFALAYGGAIAAHAGVTQSKGGVVDVDPFLELSVPADSGLPDVFTV